MVINGLLLLISTLIAVSFIIHVDNSSALTISPI